MDLPDYSSLALPEAEEWMKKKVFKLPTLPNAQSDLIDQYLVAFDKVFSARESILSAYQSGDIKVELADIVACLEAMRAA